MHQQTEYTRLTSFRCQKSQTPLCNCDCSRPAQEHGASLAQVLIVLAASALKRQHTASVLLQLRDTVAQNINLCQAADQVGTNHMKAIEISEKDLKRDTCTWNQQLLIDSNAYRSHIQHPIRLDRSPVTKRHKAPTLHTTNTRCRHLRRADFDSWLAWQRQIDHGQGLGFERLQPL